MANKLFPWVCWVISTYFAVSFLAAAGFPPKGLLNEGIYALLVLFVFFFLLPFAKTLKLGNFFEYSAKIEEVKSEVRDFKKETRELISLQNSLINNVSQSMNNNVNISVPSITSALNAEEQLAAFKGAGKIPKRDFAKETNDVFQYIEDSGSSDFALMKLRRDLEIQLRRILRKENPIEPSSKNRNFLNMMSLWNLFIAENKDRQNLEPAFRYVVDMCNAAAHGRSVPLENAEEAISMGLRVLEILRKTK